MWLSLLTQLALAEEPAIRLILVGDTGKDTPVAAVVSAEITRRMTDAPDAILVALGDLYYNQPPAADADCAAQTAARYRSFFGTIDAARTQAVAGNHDVAEPETHAWSPAARACTEAAFRDLGWLGAAEALANRTRQLDGGGLTLDLGFVHHRAAQKAALVVGVVLDDFQRQTDGGNTFVARHPGKLQQQAVRVVQLGAVVRPGVQLLDIGRAEVIGFDARLHLVKGGTDPAEVEVLVLKKAHAARLRDRQQQRSTNIVAVGLAVLPVCAVCALFSCHCLAFGGRLLDQRLCVPLQQAAQGLIHLRSLFEESLLLAHHVVEQASVKTARPGLE